MDYITTFFAFKLFKGLWDYILFVIFFQGPMYCYDGGQSCVGISYACCYILV